MTFIPSVTKVGFPFSLVVRSNYEHSLKVIFEYVSLFYLVFKIINLSCLDIYQIAITLSLLCVNLLFINKRLKIEGPFRMLYFKGKKWLSDLKM